ncbi:MAG: cation transporter [Lachnospiraceae bacterium]|nr:heavy-metal-associated domain-containing protein [Lachnospiraceae bacterium]MCR5738451.1 cation transporter [Lachnospiraceae bacterium]
MSSVISNAVIILLLAVILFFSVKSTIAHFKGQGSCCGGGGSDVKTKPKKLKNIIATRVVRIEGMHCEHCYTRVSNLLNSMDGVSAVVRGRKGIAVVRMEKLHSDEEIEQAITDMGYGVLSISGK